MTLWARWKKHVESAITLDIENTNGHQDIEVTMVLTTSG